MSVPNAVTIESHLQPKEIRLRSPICMPFSTGCLYRIASSRPTGCLLFLKSKRGAAPGYTEIIKLRPDALIASWTTAEIAERGDHRVRRIKKRFGRRQRFLVLDAETISCSRLVPLTARAL